MRVVDVSDPVNPIEVGTFDTDIDAAFVFGGLCAARDLAVSEGYAYIADGCFGLRVVDVSYSGNPTEVGCYVTSCSAYGVAVAAGDPQGHTYAYIADGHYGLRVVDASYPTRPTGVGHLFPDYDSYADAVTVVGNYGYVIDGVYLWVVDISDPANPTKLGSCYVQSPKDVVVAGDYAYIASKDSLRVVDISDPTNPTEVASCYMPDIAWGVVVAGGYAYVADGEAGLRVVDVSDPTNPTEVGFYDTPGNASDVAVAGNYAYIADRAYGLRVVDVSDPSNPTEISYYITPKNAYDVAVVENYAYVVGGPGGGFGSSGYLWVLDVSDPSNPTEVGYYDTPGQARDVAVAGDYLWVADGSAGLIILRFTGGEDTTPPTIVSTSPEDGATDVAIDTVVTATFSEAMDSSTINTDSFTLAGGAVAGTLTYDSDTYTATFIPDANLDYDHEYAATLNTAITDEAGDPLAEPYTWSFTTESAPADTIPPDAVTDLTVSESTINSVTLIWTAPGDDGNVSTASTYDIRYSTSEITDANWASATQCTGEPAPQSAGSTESFVVTGLSAGTTYYFALKTANEVPNWSDLSNVPSGTTEAPPENQPPTAYASDTSGQPQTMYPDTIYSVTAQYYDLNGRDDLKSCYLQLRHPSKPLTMMWSQSNGSYSPWAGEEGANYLTITGVASTELANGYELTWSFRINGNWPPADNSIDFGVSAREDDDLESGWDYDNSNASFITNQPPHQPINLSQFKADGATAIPVGGTTNESTVVFKGRVSDPDGDQVKLQIELRRLDEYSGEFDETTGGLKESNFVESGSEAVAYAYELVNGDYHWRARTIDTDSKSNSDLNS